MNDALKVLFLAPFDDWLIHRIMSLVVHLSREQCCAEVPDSAETWSDWHRIEQLRSFFRSVSIIFLFTEPKCIVIGLKQSQISVPFGGYLVNFGVKSDTADTSRPEH